MKTILLVSTDQALIRAARRLLAPRFRIVVLGGMIAAVDAIYTDIPDLLIVDASGGNGALLEGVNNLKDDPLFSQLPVLLIFGDQPPVMRWEGLLAEDYLRRGDLERDLSARASLAVIRSARCVEINPLTRLPGNISINREITERLERDEIFALAYADLSDFKPFNDKYAFSRGDEVLRITGRLILSVVKSRQPLGGFVGHIGGDDFVFIMEAGRIEVACDEIIQAFDRIIPSLYDPGDRERGGIDSVDRRGTARFFPLITIAIGVAGTATRRFSHFGELTSAASEMKQFAKKARGSACRVDRRNNGPV
jgi:GGDEF domain-containing protein